MIGILGITLVIALSIIIFLTIKLNKIQKYNNTLTDEIVQTKTTPIMIGRITKYKDKDLELLLSNPDLLDILLTIFEYKIAIKTDSIRSLEDTSKKVGYLDCLHETHLYFYKLKQKLKKKDTTKQVELI